jgi:hypothetical protein
LGDRVKTDTCDARRLARLYRAGELFAIRIPTVAEEAVRDLGRARADMVVDRTRAWHRLGKFPLRHGRIWRAGITRPSGIRSGSQPSTSTTWPRHYRSTLSARNAAVDVIDVDNNIETWLQRRSLISKTETLAITVQIAESADATLADARREAINATPGSAPGRNRVVGARLAELEVLWPSSGNEGTTRPVRASSVDPGSGG